MQAARAANGNILAVLEERLTKQGLQTLLAADLTAPQQANPTAQATTERWPDPIGQAAYHGVTGDIVRAIEPHTEADPAALMVQFLVSFGNLIDRRPYFVAEATKHYTNLFAAVVGRSAKGRKGTSWGHIERLLGAVDDRWHQSRVASGMQSGEGLIHAVRDPVIRHNDDGTAVTEDPGVTDKRLLVVESELASVIRRFEQTGNSLSAIIRQAWDAGNLSSLTRNSPARATNAHISIIGHITRDELLRVLGDTEIANGFANRFLWVLSRRSKLLPDGGGSYELGSALHQITNAWEHAAAVGELRRDSEARDLWHRVYPILSAERGGMHATVASRAEAQVMRLALVYAVPV
jgi:hypothetical protein